jgi:hypothetical protein
VLNDKKTLEKNAKTGKEWLPILDGKKLLRK